MTELISNIESHICTFVVNTIDGKKNYYHCYKGVSGTS